MTHPTDHSQDPEPRIFKIGATIISEVETLAGCSLDEIKDILKHSYPEVAHATVNTRTSEDGTQIIEFLPKPGRKG
jgi:hypothetical protein